MAAPSKNRARLSALALLFYASGSRNDLAVADLAKDCRSEKEDASRSDMETGREIKEEATFTSYSASPDSWSESEHDDSNLNEGYASGKDDRPDSYSDSYADWSQHNAEETEEEGGERRGGTGAGPEARSVKRHKHPRPDLWKRQVIKDKRLKGESYKNAMGQEIRSKTMGPPCTSQHCFKSNKRGCDSLSVEERSNIFNNFWSMPSWETRKLYVQTLVESVPVKQRKRGAASRRTKSLLYHLQWADKRVPVCKNLFSSTLGVTPRTIGSWLAVDMNSDADLPKHKPKINKTGPHAPIPEADQTFLKDWLSRLPTIPSHYCSQVSSYQDMKFLKPGTVLSDLYKQYQKAAGESRAKVVSDTYFRKAFHEQKYSVFSPRKVHSDVCVSAEDIGPGQKYKCSALLAFWREHEGSPSSEVSANLQFKHRVCPRGANSHVGHVALELVSVVSVPVGVVPLQISKSLGHQ